MIPDQAVPFLPILAQERAAYFQEVPTKVLAGLIDHETACPVPRKCWNPKVNFETSRERGAGLGQITKVFGRFDALQEMRDKHPSLAGWNWETTLYDPRYQLRGIVLKNRDNYKHMSFAADMKEREAFMLTAYNAGVGGVLKDRTYCRNTANCDPSRWFGHVQTTCTASKTKLQGYGLTFCQIRGKYADDIMHNRAPRYEGWK